MAAPEPSGCLPSQYPAQAAMVGVFWGSLQRHNPFQGGLASLPCFPLPAPPPQKLQVTLLVPRTLLGMALSAVSDRLEVVLFTFFLGEKHKWRGGDRERPWVRGSTSSISHPYTHQRAEWVPLGRDVLHRLRLVVIQWGGLLPKASDYFGGKSTSFRREDCP